MSGLSKFQPKADLNLEKALVQEQPTEKLAREISREVFGVKLSREQKAALGRAIHWSYGIFWGGAYGVLRRRLRGASWGAGLPFGVAFSLFGNALMLPMMKLTPPARKFPLSSQLRGVASHYAYAATIDCVCNTLERVERRVSSRSLNTKPELRRVS
jgi:uncharacterized membrane protein YagU involved in acid resistance